MHTAGVCNCKRIFKKGCKFFRDFLAEVLKLSKRVGNNARCILSEPGSKLSFFPDEPVDCGQSAATGHQMSQLLPGLLSCGSGSEN